MDQLARLQGGVSGTLLQKAIAENEAASHSSKYLDFLTWKGHNGR